jgi:hypothetical protein
MMEIDPDGVMALAAAIARQWIHEQPDELHVVAAWLGLDTHQLRRTARAEHPGDGVATCRQCGARLPMKLGGGRRREYCGDRCRRRYGLRRGEDERTQRTL